MQHIIEMNDQEMEKRFNRSAKGAAAQIIARLVGYGLPEDHLARAMDDIPRILMRALGYLRDDLMEWRDDYMRIVEQPEEPTTVVLDGVSDQTKRVGVIRIIREITGLGLKESKDKVEGAPQNIKENIPKDEAEAIKARLEECGAVVRLK